MGGSESKVKTVAVEVCTCSHPSILVGAGICKAAVVFNPYLYNMCLRKAFIFYNRHYSLIRSFFWFVQIALLYFDSTFFLLPKNMLHIKVERWKGTSYYDFRGNTY